MLHRWWRQSKRNKMIILERKKAVTVIAAMASVDLSDLDEIRLSDDYLFVRYNYGTNKEEVRIPCRWNMHILESRSIISITVNEITVDIRL